MKDILSKVIEFMILATQNKNLTSGEQKKKYVLDAVRSFLELPESTEDLIIEFIDIIIKVDKGKLTINPKIKKNFLCCFKCQ